MRCIGKSKWLRLEIIEPCRLREQKDLAVFNLDCLHRHASDFIAFGPEVNRAIAYLFKFIYQGLAKRTVFNNNSIWLVFRVPNFQL